MTRCLVVDDDPEIRSSLCSYLQSFGLQAQAAADGATMRRLVQAGTADLVLLDLMLPGEDGLSLLRWVQQQHPNLPVIMLTARGDPTSRIVGLELGADDYVAKPFEPRELIARIQAVLRRGQRGGAAGARMARFAGWRFDRVARQLLTADEVTVPLSAAEFRLLSAFVEHPGRVLSRERLLELTRAPGVDVNDRSIDLAVSRLRAKLGDTSREPTLLRTVRGEGYLFDVEVQ
ncbi:response regulator [Rubrivivax rivuli]|uniref:Response regulator transcription factor n=1 Tax=Rubrivivax rivuli TaxID=1862385 RepID=A0A437RR67_9BURK|nr:response regulator transcription factor [Rubrivivax rivuli]RVU49294.1 response regulator transcription factor [Rubrivivax rivuli]